MKRWITIHLPLLICVLVAIALYVWEAPMNHLKVLVDGATFTSYAVFVALLFLATVFMPVTVMPIIPMSVA